jgi:hypothetical protein
MKNYHAFIDESGNIYPTEQSHFLLIAALGVEDPTDISRTIRRIKKRNRSSLPPDELKARKMKPAMIKKMLACIAQSHVQIVTVIVDPYILHHLPDDEEDVYRWAVARTVFHVVEKHKGVEIHLDRRYTKEALRYKLEKQIRYSIRNISGQYVLVRQEDSNRCLGLQAVDVIAWSIFQKYEKNDCQYYDLIAPLIVKEEWLSKKQWDTRDKKPSGSP